MYQKRRQIKVKPRATTVGGKFQADLEPVDTLAGKASAFPTNSQSAEWTTIRFSAGSPPPKGLIARASTAVFPVEPVWLSDALVYIRAHTGDNLTADDIYRHLGLSHSTVSSMFRKKLGTTVQQEIAQARIETAKRLLKETDLRITQIARKSGFGSVEYLCHCFAQTCGCSPSAFRT